MERRVRNECIGNVDFDLVGSTNEIILQTPPPSHITTISMATFYIKTYTVK